METQREEKKWRKAFKAKAFSVIKKIDPALALVCVMAVSITVFAIYSLIKGPSGFLSVFFRDSGDLFMDYFNSIRDAAQGTGVYTDRNVIYPPMANLIFLLFARIVPNEYLMSSWENRQTWVEYPSAILSVFLFLTIPTVLLVLLARKNMKGRDNLQWLAIFLLIFSIPMLYLYERGNSLIWTVLAVSAYLFCYDDESVWKRELALVALAFAFSLKLYPAILGLPLLADRRYKDAARCAVYGIALLVLPSFCFGGPKCFLWIYENIRNFSSNAGNGLGSFLFCAGAIFYIIACFMQKDRCKVWLFGMALLRVYPALSSNYSWTLFFAPVILLCNKNERLNENNWLYFLLSVEPFLFIPGFNWVLNYALVTLILYGLLALSGLDTVRALKEDHVRRFEKASGDWYLLNQPLGKRFLRRLASAKKKAAKKAL